MRFESKRDLWILLVLRVVPLMVLAIVAGAWYAKHGDIRGPLVGAALLIFLEIFFFESIVRSTYYIVDDHLDHTHAQRSVVAGAFSRSAAHRIWQKTDSPVA